MTNNYEATCEREAREANRQSRNAEYERVCPPPAAQESHVDWEETYLAVQFGYALSEAIEVRDKFLNRSQWDTTRAPVKVIYKKLAEVLGPVIGEAMEAKRVAQEALGHKINERAVA